MAKNIITGEEIIPFKFDRIAESTPSQIIPQNSAGAAGIVIVTEYYI